jgi:ketosteroid isomerase-like protein
MFLPICFVSEELFAAHQFASLSVPTNTRRESKMKRTWLTMVLVFGCILGLMVVAGCGKGGGKTPEQTVKKMFNAAKNKDLDGMLECYAPDVREMFEKAMELQGKDQVRQQMSAGGEEAGKLKILDTKIDGDSAQVKISVTAKGKTEEETLHLSKIDGVWLLDIPKEDKKEMKEGMEALKDPEAMKKKMMETMTEEMRKKTPNPTQ